MMYKIGDYMFDKESNNKLQCNRFKSKFIHKDTVSYVDSRMASSDDLKELAEFFKVIGDFTRVRIISALEASEMCVYDLALLLDMSQSAISHQLRVLKKANLVKNRKEGKNIFYSLKDDHIENIFNQGFIHIKEEF